MKKIGIIICMLLICSCTNLTKDERDDLRNLKSQGITVDRGGGDFERPASPVAAGALNMLPGFGNFYLANGDGADSSHWLYGFLNLITWPFSVIWGVSEAAIDASTINKRELVYYYKYDYHGKNQNPLAQGAD